MKGRTKLIRVYADDVNAIQARFPKVSMASFFHVTTKTNPLIQVEAFLRGPNDKRKKR